MNTRSLDEKVYDFTSNRCGISAPFRVLLGLSGGADSMALLHILHGWSNRGVDVVAVHVHHGIRGEEADRDEQFVCEQCRALGVPLYVVHADVPAIASAERTGLEETGRAVRYAVFDEVASQVGADVIATAHTASDQAETVLMHIVRGSGSRGITGIRPRRGAIIRPLLSAFRAELEAYCAENAIPYVTDSTNADPAYTRNAVRQCVLPVLRDLNPAADAALCRLADHTAADEEYLDAVARDTLDSLRQPDGSYQRQPLLSQHSAIRYRVLRMTLEESGCRSLEEKHLLLAEQCVTDGHGAVELPGDRVLSADQTTFRVAARVSAPQDLPCAMSVSSLPFTFQWMGETVTLRLVDTDDTSEAEKVHKLFLKYAIDYDKIQGELCLRPRRSGDAFHPAGRGIGKTVKALFQECGIPTAERDAYPLLCDEAGIVLVPGLTCDDRVRTSVRTRHFLVWQTDDRS